MSDLRTRIAGAIMRHWEDEPSCTCQDCALALSDAVIAALDLIAEEDMDIDPAGQPRFYRRYVTAWTLT